MTHDEVVKFSKNVYGSTTYSHKMRLVTYNDNYVLMQKPPSTEYVGRFSNNVYSESEWFLVNFKADISTLRHSPSDVSAFYKSGRMLKSDKELLKTNFNIIFPEKAKNKRIATDKWVIIFNPNFFHSFPDDCFKLYKLVIDKGESLTIFDDKKNLERTISKNKFNISFYDNAEAALGNLLKIERKAKEYNQLIGKSAGIMKEIFDFFR